MGTEGTLFLYYVGFGFVIFLAWAGAVGSEINRDLSPVRRVRYDRAARVIAVVGLVHPAVAVTGLDIARQLARFDDLDTDRSLATLRLSGWGTALSAVVAAAVLAVGLST